MEPSPSTESSTSSVSTTGLQTNIASLLAFVFGWVSGLVFLLIEKKDETVRWHAAQSFVFCISLFVAFTVLMIVTTILAFLPFVGWIVNLVSMIVFPLLSLGYLIVWIILIIKAAQGDKWELPLVGKLIPMALKIKT